MIRKKNILILFLLIWVECLNAQNIDSLKTVLKKQKGIEYLKTLRRITVAYTDFSNYDTAIIFAKRGIKYASENNIPLHLAKFKSTYAIIYWNKGEFAQALKILRDGLAIAEKIKDKQTIADINNNLGLIHWDNGEYPAALTCLEKSLSLYKKIADEDGISSSLLNIGLIYNDLNDLEKALKYYRDALAISQKLKDEETVAQCYSNIGSILDDLNKPQESMNYYIKALQIAEKLKNKRAMALYNNNIGTLLFDLKKYDEALAFYNNSLNLYREIGDLAGLLLILNNIGDINGRMENYQQALVYFLEAEKIGDTTEMLDHLSTTYYNLALVYASLNDFKRAYFYHTLYNTTDDTLANRKNSLEMNTIRTAFEVKEKEKEFNRKRKEERKAAAIAKKQQLIIIICVAAVLLLTLVFAAFLYKRIKISLQQNKIIHEQKHTVEEKNKEITDSINYAKRIQRSVITSENYLRQHLKDVFVLFLPKDIVAGDFYWGVDTKEGFLFATADCTGHGVPGAFMSVMGINFLNEITIERGILAPHKILNELRKNIIKTINQEGNEEEGKDGMDVSLYLLNKKTMELTYAAANNPIWIIGKNGVQELEPDKMPIGIYNGKENIDFRSGSVKLEKGDMIYSFTDGYPDQFGGEKGKKFKYANLKNLLVEVSKLSMDEQKKLVHAKFDKWKGKYEQTDDICVIGVRV